MADDKEPRMIVTVFRSRLRPGLQDEYVALVERMNQIAKTIPGYIAHKGFWADDGERVTIVEFEHEEGQRAWRTHPEHIEAQKLGRSKYYEMYDIKVCNVIYDHHYERQKEPAAGA
jgi:heme-degrading monooxygenase HmoA